MQTFKFKTFGRYTVVSAQNSNTFLMEIIVTKVIDYKHRFRIVRRWKSDHWDPIPKRHRFPLPDSHQIADWLVFEGHDLGLTVDTRIGKPAYLPPFRLVSADAGSLKSYITERCLNLTLPHLARIRVYDQLGADGDGEPMYPPVRILCTTPLFEEREVFPGIYFAITHEGRGVLHNAIHYLAMAYLYVINGSNYRVCIYGEAICGDKRFSRTGYRSQVSANKALLFHAEQLYRSRNPVKRVG